MPNPQQIYDSVGSGETDFAITFAFLRPEDLEVTVDGVAVSWELAGSSTARLTVPTTGGETVVVKRVTDIDDPFAVFTTSLSPTNLNKSILQALYALQEINFRVDSLNLADLDPDYVPPATAVDKMLVSQNDGQGGFEWAAVDVSSIASGAFTLDPSGQADNTFIVVESNALAWKTKAEVQTILNDGGINLPDPTGSGQRFVSSNTGGTGYELLSAANARSRLGLGTAAVKNTGLTPGAVLVLDDAVNYGGTAGNPALPSIDIGGLIGVAATPTYATFVRELSATASENDLNVDDDILKFGTFVGTAPSWAAAYNAGGSDNVGIEILTAGTYEIEVEFVGTKSSVFESAVQLELSGGTTDTSLGLRTRSAYGGASPNRGRSVHRLVATVAANTYVRAKMKGSTNIDTYAASTGDPTAFMRIKKIA